MRAPVVSTLAARCMHLNTTINYYLKRPNQTRRNRLREDVDFINALALPRYYVKVTDDGTIRVFLFDSSSRQNLPKALTHAAREIFEAAGDGTFIITKSHERETGLRVNGEGHEQANHSE